jgi:Dolichyl-phosphate-mannose-protein mannosyltransferase
MTAAAMGNVDARRNPGNRRAWWTRLLVASPELVAAAVAGFSVGPMILLLAGHFRPAPVLITGVVGAAVAVWLRGVDVEQPDGSSVRYTGYAAGGVVVWFLANVGFTGQNVYATRDPATYNITARWLMDHGTLHIPTNPAVFGAPGGTMNCGTWAFCNGGAGFSPVNGNQVYSQGNHLMPALGAVIGWIFGTQGMFRANLILGALALFVFFGLVRRVVGAPWALLAMVIIAVSMPMLYVSRDMYSEPLMMLFLMGALSMLYRATSTRRVRDFALAGFVAGCSAMVRIDAYGALLSILLAAIVLTGVAAAGTRRGAAIRGLALIVAGLASTLVGWLDVTRLSYGYYRDTRKNIVLEEKGALALLVVGVIAIALVWRPGVRTWLARERTRRLLTSVLTGALILAFLVFLSRPLWSTTHGAVNNVTLAIWQQQSGVKVDGTLLYNEKALSYIASYYSWVTIVLAVAGYALLLRMLVRRRDYGLTAILGMGLTMSALYLWDWQITADQPWGMRRFVPVIIPLLVLAAMVGLKALRALQPRADGARKGLRVVGVLAPIAMLAMPIAITAPMVAVREEEPQYKQVQAICAAVGSRGAVLEIDLSTLNAYGQTMRSYCDVPSLGLVNATPTQLAAANAAAHAAGRRLYVMWQPSPHPPQPALAANSSTAPFSTVIVQRWPDVVGHPPRKKGGREVTIDLATVGAGGLLVPVS